MYLLRMKYIERIAAISEKAGLSEKQKDLLRKITDPLFGTNEHCEINDVREIIITLAESGLCKELEVLIKEKREHLEFEPSAYPDFADDVVCG